MATSFFCEAQNGTIANLLYELALRGNAKTTSDTSRVIAPPPTQALPTATNTRYTALGVTAVDCNPGISSVVQVVSELFWGYRW